MDRGRGRFPLRGGRPVRQWGQGRVPLWGWLVGIPALGMLVAALLGRNGVAAAIGSDLVWTASAFSALAGMLLARRAARGAQRVVSALETLPLIAAALALTAAELWPYVTSPDLGVWPSISALLRPILYVPVAVLGLQAMTGGWMRGVRPVACRLVLGGAVMQALAFVLWSKTALPESHQATGTLVDLVWMLGSVAVGAGGALAARSAQRIALAARSAELAVRSAGSGTRATGSAGGLGLISPYLPLAAPPREAPICGSVLPMAMFVTLLAALLNSQSAAGSQVPKLILTAGLLCCAVALGIRGRLLERRLRALQERERGAVADLAERGSALARLNQRLVEDSRHDALTGMRNRRALSEDLPRLERTQRPVGDSTAMALCDIDHFKAYNDDLGHLAGDHALRTVAEIVRGALREGDVAYRFGGEELLLVLHGANLPEARAAAERVRASVERAALAHPTAVDGIVTISIGVAAGADDSATLLAQADAALYGAKQGGRNRVVTAIEVGTALVAQRRHSLGGEMVTRQLGGMLSGSRPAY